MWKQWVNVALGLLVAVLAYYGVAVAWVVACGFLVAIFALWAGLEGVSESSKSMAHAR